MKSTFTRRLAAGASTALVGSLAFTAVALADGAGDNVSRVTGSFTPNLQDGTTFGKGALFVQVETDDADGNNQSPPVADTGPFSVAQEEAEQVVIDFDDDFKFTANGKLAKCSITDDFDPVAPGTQTLEDVSTQQALAACPKAAIGAGAAVAQLAPSPVAAARGEFTITVFNGPTTTVGGACDTTTDDGGPAGCEFDGGNPQILLHARSDALNTTVLTRGEVRNSLAGGEFGKTLDVTDAPDVNDGNGSLNLFGSTVTKSYTNGKKGNKKKTYSYVSARCDDDEQWEFNASWEYDDQTSDTDTHISECAQK